jgi:ankyrin repeat protein
MMAAVNNGHKDIVDALIRHKCSLDLQNKKGKIKTALMLAKSSNHVEMLELIEIQLRRNRNWDHKRALMMVLVGCNYLP